MTLALVIGILDLIPAVAGSQVDLVPWSGGQFSFQTIIPGDLASWPCTALSSLLRQSLQPKLFGDMGIHPLAMLAALYL